MGVVGHKVSLHSPRETPTLWWSGVNSLVILLYVKIKIIITRLGGGRVRSSLGRKEDPRGSDPVKTRGVLSQVQGI